MAVPLDARGRQRRAAPLSTALIADLLAQAFDRATASGRPIDPPLLLCLDEAANVAPLPNLDEIASTASGQGVQEIERVSTRRQRLELELGARTYGRDFKRLASANRLRQAERDQALLVYGRLPPASARWPSSIPTAAAANSPTESAATARGTPPSSRRSSS